MTCSIFFSSKPGQIRIGGYCFEVQYDKTIYAKRCVPTNRDQQWVYDGTRIRSARDPTVSEHYLELHSII